ncbi:MAG TPA: hypothetical protein VFE48_09420 [Methylomirabilota bacterium]|jgi:ABC-type Fe3+/spermidine/putrescine transport system ATPase subunit|nr:hypothetical protein [Methylomirabilota bacterium]
MAGASIQLLELGKRYGEVVAVDTTLMMIAGFEEPAAGDIRLAGEPITNRPPRC